MRTIKVLIIEDSPEVTLVVVDTLEDASKKADCDLEIDTIPDGDNAEAMHALNNYDLIIVDLVLSGKLNGIEVMRNIRAKDVFVEFIIITGFATIETAIEAISLDVWAYFRKPFVSKELVEQAHKAIESSILKKKIARLNEFLNHTQGRL